MALSNKGAIMIGDKEFIPKSLKIGYESLQSAETGRTEDGVMRIDWVRRKVYKLEIEMPPMSSEQVARLFSLVQGQEYYISFFDASENKEARIKCYTSNSSVDLYSGVVRNGLYQGVTFNAIQL